MMFPSFGGERFLYGAIALAGLVALGTNLLVEPVFAVWAPVAVSVIPLAARTPAQAVRLRTLAAALVGIVAMIGIFSVGIFLLPATALLAVSSDRVHST